MLKSHVFKIKKRIHFVVLLLLLSSLNVLSQSLSEQTFAIAEFSEEISIKSILQERFSKEHFGISIQVFEQNDTKTLKIKLNEGELSLKSFFSLLNTQLETPNFKVFPLFIKYEGDENKLINVLKSTGLLDKTFYQPKDERWPNLEDLITNNKPLIIFKDKAIKAPFNALNNHIFEYNEDATSRVENVMSNELSSIKYFTEENLNKEKLPVDWNRISVNPYCIKYLMHCWNTSGKRPNFIFYSSQRYQGTFYYLAKILSETRAIYGNIISESHILKGINWSHELTSFTDGYYSFPFEKGENLILKPLKEGYQFSPLSYDVSKRSDSKPNYPFIASKLNISDNLTALYRFDGDLTNEVHPELLTKSTPKFVNDKAKSTVLKFENKNYIKLKNVTDYNLVNSSFTLSIDFKYDDSGLNKNFCLLGSDEEGFRKGLHINIIKGKPAFGFFTNDIKSNHFAKPNTWHNLVVKYNIDTKKQSMYLNGNLIEEASSKPSFIGTSNLLLGQGIKQNNFFNGYLDNLKIWNRALSDQEIKWIKDNPIEVNKSSKKIKLLTPFLLVILGLIAALLFIIFRYKRTKNPLTVSKQTEPKAPKISQKKGPAIYLFGKFELIDTKGTNHSHKFAPKIKELFLLVLLRTIKNQNGISTPELTSILWQGFETPKAANNRGVSFNALKKILKEIDGIDVLYENKFWKIVLDDTFYFDYQWVIDFTKSKKVNYQQFFDVVKRGEFLSDVKKDWLLEEKSKLNFDILDLLLAFCKSQYKTGNYSLALEIASYVQKIDELNLQGLFYQLHSLSKKGSKNKVLFIFDNFCKKYETVNSIKFKYNLKGFLKENPEKIWD